MWYAYWRLHRLSNITLSNQIIINTPALNTSLTSPTSHGSFVAMDTSRGRSSQFAPASGIRFLRYASKSSISCGAAE